MAPILDSRAIRCSVGDNWNGIKNARKLGDKHERGWSGSRSSGTMRLDRARELLPLNCLEILSSVRLSRRIICKNQRRRRSGAEWSLTLELRSPSCLRPLWAIFGSSICVYRLSMNRRTKEIQIILYNNYINHVDYLFALWEFSDSIDFNTLAMENLLNLNKRSYRSFCFPIFFVDQNEKK